MLLHIHFLSRRSSTKILLCRYASVSSTLVSRKKTKRGTTDFTSRDHILHKDIGSFLENAKLTFENVRVPERLIHQFLHKKEREPVAIANVEIVALTSEGEGLGFVSRTQYDEECADSELKTVVKLPKAVPGDIATINLKRHHGYYAEAELVEWKSGPKRPGLRDDRLVICKHFQTCSGCQFQMMPYENQLRFKQKVIRRAFKYFHPDIEQDKMEDFGRVVESPMQYSYRTKLTPHSFIPRKLDLSFLPVPVGFNHAVPGNHLVDIEQCPISTGPINAMIPHLKHELNKHLMHKLETGSKTKVPSDFILRDSFRVNHSTGAYTNVCLSHRHNVVTEKVHDFVFQFEANEFFQNNRSILPTFVDFLGYHLSQLEFKHLIDAYCGSGFLGISLSKMLPEGGKVFGIEISTKSIEYAKHNAGINGIQIPNQIEFVAGNSDSMFTHERFLASHVKGEDSVVLMNPSRKGSTDEFLKQLVEFKPKAVVYISCNVFTQARDLASLQKYAAGVGANYTIKSVTGFDFYPQTKHVESVVVLQREDSTFN